MVGFLEIIAAGQVNPMLYRKLSVREGYYSVMHDAGQKK